MRYLKLNVVFFVLVIFLIFSVSIVFAFQASSSNYTSDTKTGYFAQTSATSTSFSQRIIASIEAVSRYISSLFSGRFGILEDTSYQVFNVSSCGNLSTRNALYILNTSVNSSGTCFTIIDSNITLDCNNFLINYSRTTNGYGVLSNGVNDSSILRCQITQGSLTRTNSHGIYLINGRNSTISNNSIKLFGSKTANAVNNGVYLINYSNNLIEKNNVSTSGRASHPIFINFNSNSSLIFKNNLSTSGNLAYGIYIYSSSHYSLINNTINIIGNNSNAVFLFNSVNNTITGNNVSIYGNTGYGFYINSNSDSNTLTSNTIFGSGSADYGIYLFSDINYTKINSNVLNLVGTNSYGLMVRSASSNNFTGNNLTIFATGGRGVSFDSKSNSNLIVNNTVAANYRAIIINAGTSNKFFNNIFNSSSTIITIANSASYSNLFNTTKTLVTNIILGNNVGGNAWINNLGSGFSQRCVDANNDGICDSTYSINNYNKDYLALSTQDVSSPTVDIWSPLNNSFVNGVVVLRANATDNSVVSNVLFQYMNSSVSWTNFPNCNDTASPYTCGWNTASFSNSSEGYFVRAIAYDGRGNNGTSETKKYTIDRVKPIIFDMSVIYPVGQSSVKNNQNITLSAIVTDSPYVGAGINYVQANLLQLNGTGWANMTFSAGSKLSSQNSTWKLNLSIISTATALKYANISVIDLATPRSNNRTGDLWEINIDNTSPTNGALSSSENLYNNTLATFSVIVSDNFKLKSYIFSSNWSGNWVNDSSVLINDTSFQIDYNKIVYTGNFSYRFFVFDDAGNMLDTDYANINVSGNAPFPSVYLIEPNNSFITNNNNINFQYYYINGSMNNCSLYLNDLINVTINSPLELTNLNFSRTLEDGIFDWFISCSQYEFDGDQNISVDYSSDSRILAVDTIKPVITIVSPLNTSYNSSNLNFNVSLSEDTIWCGYSLNGAQNISMSEVNSTYFTSTYSGFSPDSYSILFTCNDTANNFNNTQQRIFAIDFVDISINFTSPLNNSEIVRGSGTNSGEDDKGIVPDSINLTAKVYDASSFTGIEFVECYFYDNGTYLGNSATNSSGDCFINFTKSDKAIGLRDLSVNYSSFSDIPYTTLTNFSNITLSIVKYVSSLTMSNLRSNGKYHDSDSAILLISIQKTNVTGTSSYDSLNLTANATNAAQIVYPNGSFFYPGVISRTGIGEYKTNITVNYSFGTFVRWDVFLSDNNFLSFIGSAVHSDKDICKGDFGAWSSWSVCSGGTQTRSQTDSSGCSQVETRSCTSGDGGGGGGGGVICIPNWGAWSSWSLCINNQETRSRSNGCGSTDTEFRQCNCIPNWQCTPWSSCIQELHNRTCNDLNLCESSNRSYTETKSCISSLMIDYFPSQLNLYVKNNTIIPFSVNLTNTASDPMTVKWLLDSKLEKQDSGVDTLQSLYTSKFSKTSKVNADIASGLKNEEINWNVNIIPGNNLTCNENWYCKWNFCDSSGYKSPISCQDLNNCETNIDYPAKQICSCIPEFKCNEWSKCQADYSFSEVLLGKIEFEGRQYNTCKDSKACENLTMNYQVCNVTSQIIVKNTDVCYEKYIELYDLDSNKLVGRIKEKEIGGVNKLDIGILATDSAGYCNFCFDGVKNFDETEIDCGGSCAKCIVKTKFFDWLFYIKVLLWILSIILIIFIFRKKKEREEKRNLHVTKKYLWKMNILHIIKTFIISILDRLKRIVNRVKIKNIEHKKIKYKPRVRIHIFGILKNFVFNIRNVIHNINIGAENIIHVMRNRVADKIRVSKERFNKVRSERKIMKEERKVRRIERRNKRKKIKAERKETKKVIRHIKRRIKRKEIKSHEIDVLEKQLKEWENKGYYGTAKLQKKLDELKGRNPLKE